MGQYSKPIQRAKASRLYKNNPDARADLDALNADAEADPSITKTDYLAREGQIVGKHRKP